ncbi:MAG: alpha/beta hydrolase-fold protein [Akkermansiaceae bacterium]
MNSILGQETCDATNCTNFIISLALLERYNKRMLRSIAPLIILTLTVQAEKHEPGTQIETVLKFENKASIPYLQYLPKDFDPKGDRKFPLILFLHGRGESNGPLGIVKKWGPPKIADQKGLPYIVISPQCPRSSWWSNDDQQELLIKLLAYVKKEFPVDEDRVYLTGLSMGGFGSWELASRKPEEFAAVVPICGGGNPQNASKLVDLPIWNWHGDQDKVVPLSKSTEMVEAVKKAGGKKIKFTVLAGVGHNSWSPAYGEPKIWEWLANQKRGH